ncbi:hypothetical protein NT6N_11600 [Oceaniferula spumae]|uniref:Uncharacterized protein n=1 Tax=Oceaniferula spumae TaxID=2979115 RepID=A0AAT9FJL0_9BACT
MEIQPIYKASKTQIPFCSRLQKTRLLVSRGTWFTNKRADKTD